MAMQQAPGIMRTDLQRHDLGLAGREVIQNRVDIDPDHIDDGFDGTSVTGGAANPGRASGSKRELGRRGTW